MGLNYESSISNVGLARSQRYFDSCYHSLTFDIKPDDPRIRKQVIGSVKQIARFQLKLVFDDHINGLHEICIT